jgi:UDP-N-acetyl-D-galactosamine dehydrogenase
MGTYVANQLIKAMINKKINVAESKVLIMGITFKENCPDIRNSRVVDIVSELNNYGVMIEVYDPYALKKEVKEAYDIEMITDIKERTYDGIIVTVAHDEFTETDIDVIRSYCTESAVIYDLKSIYEKFQVDLQL